MPPHRPWALAFRWDFARTGARETRGNHMADEPSWAAARRASFTREEDVAFLRRAIEVSRRSREHGNTPFGAILVNEDKQVVLEQENVEIETHKCTGHAETQLCEAASQRFDHDYLWQCSLYTTGEPCAMCTGAIYWANIGRVVYAMTERDILAQTGASEQNPRSTPRAARSLPRARRTSRSWGPSPRSWPRLRPCTRATGTN